MTKETALIVISHGDYAAGAMQSAQMILGPQSNYEVVTLTPDQGREDVIKAIKKSAERLDISKGLILMTDLKGGTPANAAGEFFLTQNDVHLYCGFNLAVLMECLVGRGGDIGDMEKSMTESYQASYCNLGNILKGRTKMAIELVRIDDRLIHGQVASTWINDFNIEQVLIIDDKMAGDEIQKRVMSMTAPVNIKVQFFAVDQFSEIIANNPIKRRTMLLYASPEAVLRNLQAGLKIEGLNVGNMRFREGRTQIAYSVSLTEQEKESFHKIIGMGVEVYWQMVPREKKVPMQELLDAAEK